MDPEINNDTAVELERTSIMEVQPKDVPNRTYIFPRWANKRAHRGVLPEGYAKNEFLIKALDCFNTLQTTRKQPVTENGIYLALKHIWLSMPYHARLDTFILTPGKREFFGSDTHNRDGEKDNHFERMWEIDWGHDEEGNREFPEEFLNIFTSPYVFWPIDVGKSERRPHWATVVIHLAINPEITEGDWKGLHTVIKNIAVIDPDRRTRRGVTHAQRVRKAFQRVLKMLYHIGLTPSDHFLASGPSNREIWVPPSNPIVPRPAPIPGGLRGEFTPPTERWTSGFRCFWLIRLFLNRVTEMYCTSRRHNGEIFWADAPGYFDPDIVRQEMFGYTTAVIHRMTEYNTRAAIEPVLKVNLNGVAIEAKELKPKKKNTFMWPPGRRDENGEPAWNVLDDNDLDDISDEESADDESDYDSEFDDPTLTPSSSSSSPSPPPPPRRGRRGRPKSKTSAPPKKGGAAVKKGGAASKKGGAASKKDGAASKKGGAVVKKGGASSKKKDDPQNDEVQPNDEVQQNEDEEKKRQEEERKKKEEEDRKKKEEADRKKKEEEEKQKRKDKEDEERRKKADMEKEQDSSEDSDIEAMEEEESEWEKASDGEKAAAEKRVAEKMTAAKKKMAEKKAAEEAEEEEEEEPFIPKTVDDDSSVDSDERDYIERVARGRDGGGGGGEGNGGEGNGEGNGGESDEGENQIEGDTLAQVMEAIRSSIPSVEETTLPAEDPPPATGPPRAPSPDVSDISEEEPSSTVPAEHPPPTAPAEDPSSTLSDVDPSSSALDPLTSSDKKRGLSTIVEETEHEESPAKKPKTGGGVVNENENEDDYYYWSSPDNSDPDTPMVKRRRKTELPGREGEE